MTGEAVGRSTNAPRPIITGWHPFDAIISPRLDVYAIYFYFQICQDINECDQQNGGCVTNSKCLNTPVSIVMPDSNVTLENKSSLNQV